MKFNFFSLYSPFHVQSSNCCRYIQKETLLLTIAHVAAAKVLRLLLLVTTVALEVTALVLLWVTALMLLMLLIVVVITVGLIDVQLVLLEDELILFQSQHFRGIVLVVVGNKAESARVSDLIGDDASILDEAKVRKIISKLVLRSLLNKIMENKIKNSKK